MSAADELFKSVAELEKLDGVASDPKIKGPIQARINAANEVAQVFSGSWLGYHSRVYQQGLKAIPGARFDSQWGLSEQFLAETRGNWVEYDPERLKEHIRIQSGTRDLSEIVDNLSVVRTAAMRIKADVLSIISTELSIHEDNFLANLKDKIEHLNTTSQHGAVAIFRPSGAFRSADSIAISAGLCTPPHIEILAEAASLATIIELVSDYKEIVRQAASHLARKENIKATQSRIGTNVFLGHGRSLLWRELKDFIQDRLNLPVDEFNRVPVAGITNITRLSQMIDAAAIAFVIMTAEDETVDAKLQARMNVIHEVGLFQGRLGFTRGIVMLEDGCEEFSNIQGLGQIRFPKGRISAAFEDVRLVLERENLIG